MASTRVLIAVKTYPTLSEKYDELVCTAGFLEDGSWIRIYPIAFRKLQYDSRYSKWQWVEIDLVKNDRDFRKESYRPASADSEIRLLSKVGTEDNWAERKNIALKNVWYNMDELIKEAKVNKTSLAVLKPKQVLDFVWKECEREWDQKKLEAIYAKRAQMDLFEEKETKKIFRIAKKIPYEFSYIFITEDGKRRQMMIEDWELGMLYRHCLERSDGDELEACQMVKKKYFDEMCFEKDIYFFLGTTLKFHNVGLNPFIVIGTFYPPKESQLSLSFPE